MIFGSSFLLPLIKSSKPDTESGKLFSGGSIPVASGGDLMGCVLACILEYFLVVNPSPYVGIVVFGIGSIL